jgi:hypothetical protein
MALSYCWGSTNPAVTTRHNLKERVKEIQFSGLPRTIHDAITVTRRLGIRFLWVDALCIVQDSINGEGWVHESSRMADIYGNAYLTIVAETARNCAQGFLARRPSATAAPHDMPYYLPNGTRCGSVKVCLVEEKLEPEYVACRAWTFQERKLARRILSFNRRWTTFACHEGYTREDWGTYWVKTGSTEIDCAPAPLIYKSLENCFQKWNLSVRDYSRRHLTFERDKLPAFSGYAHSIQKHVGGNYLAGLWDCNLHSGLLWRPIYPGRKPSKPLAPSWSWAPLGGPVWYRDWMTTHDHPLTIIDCSVELSSNDPIGQVSGGFLLKCRGPLKEVAWRYCVTKNWNNLSKRPIQLVLYEINELYKKILTRVEALLVTLRFQRTEQS